jgi:hypothetical protein
MKQELFIQHICNNCLQLIENGESDHTEAELKEYNKTLDKWSKRNYIPAGLTDESEPYFDWHYCDLCHCLPGDRYDYYFWDNSK